MSSGPRRFGQLLLGDHIVLPNESHWGSGGESAGLMLKDVGTGWRIPCWNPSVQGLAELDGLLG